VTGPGSQLDVLITTWSGGGASQPAIGLGRLLVERGHRVRIMAPAVLAGRTTAAGCARSPRRLKILIATRRGLLTTAVR